MSACFVHVYRDPARAPGESDVLAHAKHSIDLLDPEPVQDVGHEGLEPHVLDAGDVFRATEVVGRSIFHPLSSIVYHYRSSAFSHDHDGAMAMRYSGIALRATYGTARPVC